MVQITERPGRIARPRGASLFGISPSAGVKSGSGGTPIPIWGEFPEILSYWDARYSIGQVDAVERVSSWGDVKGPNNLLQATAADA